MTEFITSGERPAEYEDRSTLLITILFELTALLNAPHIYREYRKEIQNRINLQTADTVIPSHEFEILLFEKSIHQDYFVETNIHLPEDLQAFKNTILTKNAQTRSYKSDVAGSYFLRLLAHIYFENEFLPDEWRQFIK